MPACFISRSGAEIAELLANDHGEIRVQERLVLEPGDVMQFGFTKIERIELN